MRYAGFWSRFGAGIVDLLVLTPIIGLSIWSFTESRMTALLLVAPLNFFFAAYNIYFVGRWGQTVGKMALKIKVVALDGTEAGFYRALLRHSVDLGYSIISTALIIFVLASITSTEYDPLSFIDKSVLQAERTPSWGIIIENLYLAWVASELLVLLLNKKRRALHDFIAGTVVVHVDAAPAPV